MIYVYKCRQCGDTFEVEQRITDAPLTHHHQARPGHANSDCNNGTIYRVPQLFGVSYRCQGFHTTDYSKEVRGERL